MGMDPNFSRVDTLELKEHIFRKVGHERGRKYFDGLKRFLCQKLSKSEFDKSCKMTIGRENIALHNRLIRAILQNACSAKAPPQRSQKVECAGVKVANGYQKSCLQSLYGDKFPQSPRKCRSPVSRKFRERPSPLGPLGKSPSIVTCEETVTRLQEQQSATELHSLSSKPPVEEGEEVEQYPGIPSVPNWSSITAPLGMSWNTSSTSKDLYAWSARDCLIDSCQTCGELPDTASLKSRLEKKLVSEGLGVSIDCAALLNKSLDVYLKRLIEPYMQIAGSRSVDHHILTTQANKQVTFGSNQMGPGIYAQRPMQQTNASMLDFRVAMEANPRILGRNWPSQFERICQYASKE